MHGAITPSPHIPLEKFDLSLWLKRRCNVFSGNESCPKFDSFNKRENITSTVKFFRVHLVCLHSKLTLTRIAMIYSLPTWTFLQALLRSFGVACCSSHSYVDQTYSASSLHYLPFLLVRTKTGKTLNDVLDLWRWEKWSGLLEGKKRIWKT